MNKVLSILLFFICLNGFSQGDNKTVTLVVSGQGKTQYEAKQNALRSAIEQAFGTFISSKTEILNDNLVKDEIVSISNGNIKKYDVVSQIVLPNGNYTITLKAQLSIEKLSSFIENKGYKVVYGGDNYALNLKNIELNKNNETKVISNLESVVSSFLNNIYSYKIKADEPKFLKNDQYLIKIYTQVVPNDNFEKLINYLTSSLKTLSLNKNEIENLKSYNFPIYKIEYIDLDGKKYVFDMRNEFSKDFFVRLIEKIENQANKIEITDGVNTLKETDYINDLNKKRNWDDYNKNNYSAFECIKAQRINVNIDKPYDLSLIKINQSSILDKEKYFLFSLNELSQIKSFNVINGIKHDASVISSYKICQKMDKKNNRGGNVLTVLLWLGIVATGVWAYNGG